MSEKLKKILDVLRPGKPPCECIGRPGGCPNVQLCDRASAAHRWETKNKTYLKVLRIIEEVEP